MVSKGQEDTLSVFRSNSNTSFNNNNSKFRFKNTVSVSVNYLARGGAILSYERFFPRRKLSIYGGYGISVNDFIGRFTYDNLELYKPDDYSSQKVKTMGRIIDVGFKFIDLDVWENFYMAFGYTYLSNYFTRTIDGKYQVADHNPRIYNLEYRSDEVKFVLGCTNDPQNRFYLDAHIGPGFRLIHEEKIQINDDLLVLYNLIPTPNVREIEVDKENEFNLKFWVFVGLKMGIRI